MLLIEQRSVLPSLKVLPTLPAVNWESVEENLDEEEASRPAFWGPLVLDPGPSHRCSAICNPAIQGSASSLPTSPHISPLNTPSPPPLAPTQDPISLNARFMLMPIISDTVNNGKVLHRVKDVRAEFNDLQAREFIMKGIPKALFQ
ncbi:hypothetical protein MKZ38_002294 [Zalerion maritima]|uniref:Uncharacterized protein n=1 Tax=Zalerion maritima TaxID=339359 RepID=A0AAD5RQE0_9PEZI|nr:hypothetical protein MKZ38_002294 [Zalerion maritima]